LENKRGKSKIIFFNDNEDENEDKIGLNGKKWFYGKTSREKNNIKNIKMISEPLNIVIMDDKNYI